MLNVLLVSLSYLLLLLLLLLLKTLEWVRSDVPGQSSPEGMLTWDLTRIWPGSQDLSSLGGDNNNDNNK